MGIASSLLGTVKKKKNEYDANKNYASQIDRTNKWSDELESLYGQISGREKFSYDMNNDAFYNQYAQQYANNAKLAMEDTVGQVSALTGGYGNSYAATAGQAMYNQQMEGLNDRATELYQLALQQYNAEGDRLANLYSMTANAYGMEQDRINSEIAEAQWNAEFDEAQRQYNLNMAYNASRALVGDAQWAAGYAFDASRAAVSDAQWEKSFAYQADRDKVSDSQWQQSFDYQKERDNVSDSQFAQEMAYKYAALNKSSSKKGAGGVTELKVHDGDNEKKFNELKEALDFQNGYNNQEMATKNKTSLIQYYYEQGFITEDTAKDFLKKYLG
jgi:hypothetical protein